MNMKNVVDDYRWIAEQVEKLADELEALLEDGAITEEEANKKMCWGLSIANRFLSASVDENMPLPNWRTGV